MLDIDKQKDTISDKASEKNNDPIGKYKSLLKAIEEEEEAKKNKEVELEFTWQIDAKEKNDKLAKKSLKDKDELMPFEQYLEKRKAKKKAKREEKKKLKNESQKSEDSLPADVDMNDKYFAEELKIGKSSSRKKEKKNKADDDVDSSNEREEEQRKAELELLLMDQNDDGKKHFNMKQIEENATMSKSKRKRLDKKKNAQEKEEAKEDDFEVDVQDPRFGALFTSHHFNIDPADPHYRKTKGTEALVSEKLKRRADSETHVEDVSRKESFF